MKIKNKKYRLLWSEHHSEKNWGGKGEMSRLLYDSLKHKKRFVRVDVHNSPYDTDSDWLECDIEVMFEARSLAKAVEVVKKLPHNGIYALQEKLKQGWATVYTEEDEQIDMQLEEKK